MTTLTNDQVQPDEGDVRTADAALARVTDYLARHPDGPNEIRLRVAEDGEELIVPRAAVELFARILAHMAAGQGVSVVPTNAELTTQQAADLLNVSRPYLIGLLDAGEIDYRKVGKHRRIRVTSLLGYLRRDDHRRREAADELTALTQEMGLT
ncbi:MULTISPECIES: helix-turn-helix domain-containing protein [unclassified Crossiella]|uniref:helix-turn-helix domain-containing protein n=1 Tax=unclassified Crossiella TaxID=2620835 RepID=UPI001FFE912E|nr:MULTISPECIES: helix-turn-helix domain-containing protein [unclassified Crossiella]MCK2242396.1 helix-turn-helix domain-containing protein [Crossiella sp. S99.2]MCK2254573.1 helix-turn-helix domain-containing protein [Crossiella sp. S99.1]